MSLSEALSAIGLGDKKKEKKLGEQESPDVTGDEKEEDETAGGGLGDKATASGNPYAMAAGAAMKVIGARAKRQKERTAALTASVNDQQKNMASGASKMASIAGGFRL